MARPSGAWTGGTPARTDIPVTENGRRRARNLAAQLGAALRPRADHPDAARHRHLQAGRPWRSRYGRDDLHEWDYGDYEGITSAEIHETDPDWSLWRDGGPNGEQAADVGARADLDRGGPRDRRRRDLLRPRPHAARDRRAMGRPPSRGRGAPRARHGRAVHARLRTRPSILVHWNEPAAHVVTARTIDARLEERRRGRPRSPEFPLRDERVLVVRGQP